MDKIKDLKIYKRFLAIVSACVMAFTSLPALAEGEKESKTNDTSITMLNEEQEQLTFDEYMNIVTFEYPGMLLSYVRNDNYDFLGLLPYVYYYFNYMYCREIREDLVNNGYLTEDLEDNELNAVDFGYEIANLEIELLKETNDINELFDYSILLRDPKLREQSHTAFETYMKVYNKGTLECDEYQELIKQRDELERDDPYYGYPVLFYMMDALYEHIINVTFDVNELKEYYQLEDGKIVGVNKKKYKYKEDLYIALDEKKIEDMTELEKAIFFSIDDGRRSYYVNYPLYRAREKIEKDYKKHQNTYKK